MHQDNKNSNASGTKTIKQINININLILFSFIYALTGFFILIAIFFVWYFLQASSNITNYLNYVLIGVAFIICYITGILDIIFLAKNKTSSWIFLLITIILNLLTPLLLLAAFMVFKFCFSNTQTGLVSFAFFAIISEILILVSAFMQIISNLVTYLECKKGINLFKNKRIIEKITNKKSRNSKKGN